MTQYVGRISFKHYEKEGLEEKARIDCMAFKVEMGDMGTPVFIFEVGDCGEPHAHFYFRTHKGRSTVERALKKHFHLPPKVCLPL